MRHSPLVHLGLLALASACAEDDAPTPFVTDGWGEEESSSGDDDEPSASDSDSNSGSDSAGDGDGDAPGDGDGDAPGDGDGDAPGDGDGDGLGDGDGDEPGDGDGDGDEPGDGDGEPEDCGAPSEHITCDAWGDELTPFQVLGLDCPGDATNSTPTTASSFEVDADESWRIATQFGSSGDWVPSEGETLLVISTGTLFETDEQGLLVADGFEQENANADNYPLPAPMSPFQGSAEGAGGSPFEDCDLTNDCSDSLFDQWVLGGGVANDLLNFDFSVMVPPGTYGWELDFAYFSNEFPEYVDSQYNDIFVVWEVSESYVGNICFIEGQPCTVTALDAIADAFSGPDEGAHPSLAGTGSGGMSHPSLGGQTTGWVRLEGPSSPGEELELHFALFDMGDGLWDTNVVLDRWRWNCEGCVPNEVDDCGVQTM